MKVSYKWLQDYFDTLLPKPDDVARALTFHAFEVEGVEKVGNDHVIDVDVLPNRSSDCLSHRGIAKEISVILEIPLKKDVLREEHLLEPKSKLFEVEIENEKLCRRFSAAVIENIKVGPSPQWLKDYLEVLGQKSINNIVDATNYVMFDLGQPLHAFDLDKLKEKKGKRKIVVRNAKEEEKITTLTGESYDLTIKNLLITDGNSSDPIGIAGIKGGRLAEIDGSTKNIIIECANFDSVNIRRSSKQLKLRTDASTRFENEPSIELTGYGLLQAVELILDIAGGKLEGYVDSYPSRPSLYKVGVSTEEINKLLGSNLKDKETEDILGRFGFEYKKVTPLKKVLELSSALVGAEYKPVSAIRFDAPKIFSCSSLTNYLYVQAGIAIPSISVDQYVFGEPVDEKNLQPGDLVFSNSGNGSIYYETKEWMPGTKVPEGVDHVAMYIGNGNIIHATRKEKSVLIEPLAKHKNIVGYRRIAGSDKDRYVVTIPFERMDLRIKEDLIEEVGRIYGYENISLQTPSKFDWKVAINKRFYYEEKIRNILMQKGFTEVYTYSFRNNGEVELQNALAEDKSWLRSNLRESITESLEFNARYADLLGLEQIKVFEFGIVFKKEEECISFALGIKNAKKQKRNEDEEVQEVIESISKEFGVTIKGVLKNGVFEVVFSRVLEELPQPEKYEFIDQKIKEVMYKPISQYPFVLRDIAVWVSSDVKGNEVEELIKKESGNLLVRTALFDEFQKNDKVSYAFRLVFQSFDKTLSDEEINKVVEKVTAILNKQKGWDVR